MASINFINFESDGRSLVGRMSRLGSYAQFSRIDVVSDTDIADFIPHALSQWMRYSSRIYSRMLNNRRQAK